MDDVPFYFGRDDGVVDDVDDDYLMRCIGLLPPPPVHQAISAFAAYQRPTAAASLESPISRQHHAAPGSTTNVHRRMHECLASSNESLTPTEQQGPRSSRFRHIMRERLRRERLSQGYADIHARLPPGRASKGVKNVVVGAAAVYIRELEGRKRWLSARNEELERAALARSGGACCGGGNGAMAVKMRVESEHCSMADVFDAVLRRLKAMEELRVTAIRSSFCAGGMGMAVRVESKISSCEVNKAITNALMELEEIKSGCLEDPTSSTKASFSYQVESGELMS